jgi:hypothetical protein
MILDNALMFTGTSNGASGGITFAGGLNLDRPTTGTQVSSNIVDLGLIGLPSFASGGGARDMGIGDDPALKLLVVCTQALAGGTSIQAVLSGAPDNGSGLPGAFTAMWSGPVVLLASAVAGAYLANVDVPRTIPGQPVPRFLQLSFVSAGTFTWAGTGGIEATIVVDRFDQLVGATGAVSGYPPGIVIAN